MGTGVGQSLEKLEKLKFDLYEILGLEEDCSKDDVIKAWRKKALTCHPDKNPDDPLAAEKFLNISKALELLTCEKTKAAYDRLRKAKKVAELRNRELDAKRRKLKEDLEARESAAQRTNEEKVDTARRLQKEIERLRKEGSTLLQNEMDSVSKLITDPKPETSWTTKEEVSGRLKVRWKKDHPCTYSQESLRARLLKYGSIDVLVYKEGSSLVQYHDLRSAWEAFMREKGVQDNPLKISWISEPPSMYASSTKAPHFAQPAPKKLLTDAEFDSFEEATLLKLQKKQRETVQNEQEHL